MLHGSRKKARSVTTLAIALAAITAASVTTAADAAPAPPKFVGHFLAADETATSVWGRDGGVSVPLPNGRSFWVFADTPRWGFVGGQWKLTGFIRGSSAGMVDYKPGKIPTAKFLEVNPGRALSKKNKAVQFMPNPTLHLPNGSGKVCTKANGGPYVEAVRWATGATLLPDKTNVFIPYVDVCVIDANNYTVQGWGFSWYNWKKNKLSVPPYDVIKPASNGAAITSAKWFSSPVVANGKITMYSATCCNPGNVYTVTVGTSIAALKKASNYVPKVVQGLPPSILLSVTPPTKTQPKYLMYQAGNTKGAYRLFYASKPGGPWAYKRSGNLPKCNTSPKMCTSFAIHPEFGTANRSTISYWLPGSGPGIGPHKDPGKKVAHVVFATVPF